VLGGLINIGARSRVDYVHFRARVGAGHSGWARRAVEWVRGSSGVPCSGRVVAGILCKSWARSLY
jgi:hypothetical protein